MGDRLAGHVRVHRHGVAFAQVLMPGQRGGTGVQRLFVGAVERGQRPQHPAGQPRPQHRPLRVGQGALGIDPGDGGRGARDAQRLQLVGQQVFQALGAGETRSWPR